MSNLKLLAIDLATNRRQLVTPSTGGGGAIKIPFAYGDASPATLSTVPAGTTIFTAIIVMQVPFNGVGSALRLGDPAQSDRLFPAAQNDPTRSAEYETNPGYTYLAATPILLTITPGAGCTQGAGFILLEV